MPSSWDLGGETASLVSWRVARLHHHGSAHWRCWRHQLHVTVLGLLSTLLYVVQCVLALRMLLDSGDGTAVTWLALVLVGLYLVGIVRAWTLLGNPQRGWSGWLNPLQDLPRGPKEILTGTTQADAATRLEQLRGECQPRLATIAWSLTAPTGVFQ